MKTAGLVLFIYDNSQFICYNQQHCISFLASSINKKKKKKDGDLMLRSISPAKRITDQIQRSSH